ncbi:MAG: FtsK/SpoIIIE domain-containing protein [Streptosporangiaceae bacterium]
MTEVQRFSRHDLRVVPEPVEADVVEADMVEAVDGALVEVDQAAAQEELAAELAVVEEGEVVEGEIVDDDAVYRRPLPGRPAVPVWVTNADERRLARQWATSYALYLVRYHGARSPVYAVRAAGWVPRGAWQVARAWHGWVFDVEAKPLRARSIEGGASGEYVSLGVLRDGRVKTRLKTSGGVALAAVLIGRIGPAAYPGPVWAQAAYALGTVALAVLVFLGRPKDRPFIDRAVLTSDVAPKLQPSQVVRALRSLGISAINAAFTGDGEGITFAGDPVRDGPGWRADIDLPFGVEPSEVIARRGKLASGLRRNIGCVWPEADSEQHAGRLILFVSDKPLRQLKMPMWPLLKEGRADIFRPLPLGVDVRGRPVDLDLIFQNLLIGAMPRQGKTFSLRVLLLAASLDPIVRMLTHELKGTGDLSPLRKISHRYSSGIIDSAVESALHSLEYLDGELERRSELIKDIAARYPLLCPENKVTRGLCEDPRFDLDIIVAAIDEAQNLFAHPEFGERAAYLAERIIKVGPALGIILILATQKPNAKSLPTGVKANVVLRMALRVSDQDTNDQILGTSQYRNGNRATMFSKKDLGIGLLLGETDDPQIVRTYYIDNPQADAITDRALLMRQAAGVVTGVAAGELTAIEPAEGLPEHLDAVWPAGEKAVWLEILLPRIVADHPGLYTDWTTVDLGNACRDHGIDRKDIGRGTGPAKATRKGITRTVLDEALKDRLTPV